MRLVMNAEHKSDLEFISSREVVTGEEVNLFTEAREMLQWRQDREDRNERRMVRKPLPRTEAVRADLLDEKGHLVDREVAY